MNKSPDAFRTISEVAEDLDIPQHVLRFWETRFSSIRPLKRGGGRRYYRPDDVELLKGIRQLLYGQGYTIKGVQRILKEEGPRFVQGVGRGDQVASRAPVEPDAESEDAADGWAEHGAAQMREAFQAPDAMADARTLAPPRTSGATGASAQGLRPSDRDRLRAALQELLECRRVLESLKGS